MATAESSVEPHLFNQNIKAGEAIPAGDLSWRNEDIGVLGLDKKISDKLREGGVNTMGQVADRIAEIDGAEPLTKIPGLGQKAYEAILAAEEVYDANLKKRQAEKVGTGKKSKPPAARPAKKKAKKSKP